MRSRQWKLINLHMLLLGANLDMHIMHKCMLYDINKASAVKLIKKLSTTVRADFIHHYYRQYCNSLKKFLERTSIHFLPFLWFCFCSFVLPYLNSIHRGISCYHLYPLRSRIFDRLFLEKYSCRKSLLILYVEIKVLPQCIL